MTRESDWMEGLAGLSADSRAIRPGYLFAALPGSRVDGRDFIAAAVANGARVVLAPEGTCLPAGATAARLVCDPNPRRAFALAAARFHGAQPPHVAAVTGTSGKTSVAGFTRQIWAALGRKAGSLGTLGVQAPGMDAYGALTTPDPVALHATLADLAGAGVDHLAMEASSHGLDQYRLDGVRVAVAGFTNLSRDHLDYHPTLEDYLAAKTRLFTEVLAPGGVALLNADAPESATLAERARAAGRRVVTFGRAGEEIRLLGAKTEAGGTRITLRHPGGEGSVPLPLIGDFQVSNALCALGLVLFEGGAVDPAAAFAALGSLVGAPGRLEPVARHASGARILVDYAHKPGALEAVLTTLRPHCPGNLVVVFGCGGDRDRGKRPEMGAIAERLADRVYVTDDNPRGEDPSFIRSEILAACEHAIEIGDRAEAIETAIAGLAEGDLLVIAGKGHETGQTIGGHTVPFDDSATARAAAIAAGGAIDGVAAHQGGAPANDR